MPDRRVGDLDTDYNFFVPLPCLQESADPAGNGTPGTFHYSYLATGCGLNPLGNTPFFALSDGTLFVSTCSLTTSTRRRIETLHIGDTSRFSRHEPIGVPPCLSAHLFMVTQVLETPNQLSTMRLPVRFVADALPFGVAESRKTLLFRANLVCL